MPETVQPTNTQTLGQRIDAVLAPLYAEAEQHRVSLDQAKAQIEALQQQIASATQGLAKIEGQMAEVVRSLANQDPVVAAVFGGGASGETAAEPAAVSASPGVIEPADEVAATTTDVPASDPVAEAQTPAVDTTTQPIADVPAPTPAAPSAAQTEGTPEAVVPTDLDPATDQAMVDEARSLLALAPDTGEGSPEQAQVAASATANASAKPADPPADIAAAAERAVAAAAELRQKAASAE